MPDIKIRKSLLDTLFALGKSQYPDEFLAVLIEKNGIIEELEFCPGSISTESSASYCSLMMPLTSGYAGSAHSHPSGCLIPSDADLNLFPKIGRYHIIVGPPFEGDSWKAFRVDGTPFEMEVADD